MRHFVRADTVWTTLAALAISLMPAVALGADTAAADAVVARAERAMGTSQFKTLRFAASGSGGIIGQAFEPGKAWPKVTISAFSRAYDFANAAMREDSARSRAEPNGGGCGAADGHRRPAPKRLCSGQIGLEYDQQQCGRGTGCTRIAPARPLDQSAWCLACGQAKQRNGPF